MSKKNLQFVWPKDGDNGSDRRGWKGRFSDVLSGKGPDMFIQKAGSKRAIKLDQWANWDSYHSSAAAYDENYGPAFQTRGQERYDPYTRKYVKWGQPNDWLNWGVNFNGGSEGLKVYPRYTEDERKRIYPRACRDLLPDPRKMGAEWSSIGPKRFRPEHNWFWRHAHRIGNNAREWLPLDSPINPMFNHHQADVNELIPWTKDEFWTWNP